MRPFADVLRELAGGEVYEQLTTELGELVLAVVETRKGGKITLELSVRPNGENSVFIAESVKVKKPEPKRGDTLFFTTGSGSLVRNDPRQMDLPMVRKVEDDQRAVRQVS